jgi:hypothetical protein
LGQRKPPLVRLERRNQFAQRQAARQGGVSPIRCEMREMLFQIDEFRVDRSVPPAARLAGPGLKPWLTQNGVTWSFDRTTLRKKPEPIVRS